ncbi:unnamed protein product [Cylicostephanus goldi]|uniref:Rhodanese domain-containing protein n=1 Tax=Cylicostephanus goldi TaxID=71465 RepID=A0A3P7M541_CYLGO|nr:unnamed protein product [Cylicostephanus goldi]
MARSAQYHIDSGDEPSAGQGKVKLFCRNWVTLTLTIYVLTLGNFLSSWNQSMVITFDDVLLNTELHNYDIVDAQTKEEFSGDASGALYGHIEGAVNVPVDTLYDWKLNKWRSAAEIESALRNAGLTHSKPVIIYCSTSLRSSMVWWVLRRLNYDARVYFGGWPEWVVRAPDELKVLGKHITE